MLILAKWNPGVELDGALNPEFSGALVPVSVSSPGNFSGPELHFLKSLE